MHTYSAKSTDYISLKFLFFKKLKYEKQKGCSIAVVVLPQKLSQSCAFNPTRHSTDHYVASSIETGALLTTGLNSGSVSPVYAKIVHSFLSTVVRI